MTQGRSDQQYITFVDFPGVTYGLVVPQRVYRATSPISHYPPIDFYQDGHEGVYLRDVLSQRVDGMAGSNDRPVTTTTSSKITLRITWTGYRDAQYPVNAREHSATADYIPKWKLAMCVAQAVKQFYENAIPFGSDAERADYDKSKVAFDDLLLLQLRQVSTGSWQPVLIWRRS